MIRKPIVAGSFYPNDSKKLDKMIDSFLLNAKYEEIKARGFVMPHAGYLYSGNVAAHGYKIIKNLKFIKVVILGPSHFVPFVGSSISTADFWETPLGKIKIWKAKTSFIDFPEAHKYEHSIEVQLPFLQKTLKNFEIMPISIGDDDYNEIAKNIEDFVDDALIIASSDLSHYHDYYNAEKIDEFANRVIPNLEIKKAEKIEACGKTGILALMKLAKKFGWSGKKLIYQNSGDVTGERDQVVGYGCYVFYEK